MFGRCGQTQLPTGETLHGSLNDLGPSCQRMSLWKELVLELDDIERGLAIDGPLTATGSDPSTCRPNPAVISEGNSKLVLLVSEK